MNKHNLSSPGGAQNDYHEQGRAIYNFRCYFCHGYSGDAKTLAASYLNPKPRDFINTPLDKLTRDAMLTAVRQGRPGTAMKSFSKTLSPTEIASVVDFVRLEFMQRKNANTRYHTVENGWPDHERYRPAFPFALGEIALDTPDNQLTPAQQQGKRLFMNSCVTCHDRAKVREEGEVWEPRAVSYPRNRYSHKGENKSDAVSGATPYAVHDISPKLDNLTVEEQLGERVFQKNCAFCHAADGTGKNWIGSFLQPHPRNLTDSNIMASMTRDRLKHVIREGLPGTTMSAWKNVLTQAQIDGVIAYINRAFHPIKE